MLVSLNVAINSYDYTLLSLLISNQFVEIKGCTSSPLTPNKSWRSSGFQEIRKRKPFPDHVCRYRRAVPARFDAFRNRIEEHDRNGRIRNCLLAQKFHPREISGRFYLVGANIHPWGWMNQLISSRSCLSLYPRWLLIGSNMLSSLNSITSERAFMGGLPMY